LAADQPELLSMPTSLAGCPRMEEAPLADARYFLECQSERVLRSPESYEALCRDSPPSQPYTDPKLKFNLKVCRNFVRRLCVIGFWHFTVNPKEVAGVFCCLEE
jgi:hypothetical protein